MRLSTSEIWEPDILVQQKFFATHTRRVPLQPEKALLFAVLSEAIETFKKYAFTSSAHGRALSLTPKSGSTRKTILRVFFLLATYAQCWG